MAGSAPGRVEPEEAGILTENPAGAYVKLWGSIDNQIGQAVIRYRFQLPAAQRRELINRWLDEHPDFTVSGVSGIYGTVSLWLEASAPEEAP